MKKKILSGIFALALLAATGYGVNQSVNSNANLSDLALNNVEALANGEVGFPWLCANTSPNVCIIDMGTMYLGKRYW
ncbi:NVEALA domain-containing protein [Proteiniphilum acetatigenes]|uniref:NVEALA domain-containing protein n=1 Tax=Proteiniphilum acetatigenes TaxID=294710 RepID=UPI00037B99E6|nr:NVEALA domain-containing protein [Proteiniphilum acetatigenes]